MLQEIKPCRACGKLIVFLRTKNGKSMPTNFESLNNKEKDDYVNGMTRLFEFGRHISHFSDCSRANDFRRK